VAQTQGVLPPGSTGPTTALYRFELQALAKLRAKNAPLRLRMTALKFERTKVLNTIGQWQGYQTLETRSAWCADRTEGVPAGTLVATAEIPGESALVVICPGCRGWTPADGVLTAREVMSPAQAFLNAAILPGWQKFKPTYRWGTATAIDYAANTMSVALAEARSSAQALNVNQASSLSGVPVQYLTCNASAFEVGDRVVVEFQNQQWSQPRVIGFLDNPKPCTAWPAPPAMAHGRGSSRPRSTLLAV
jgi:hypothetical protein